MSASPFSDPTEPSQKKNTEPDVEDRGKMLDVTSGSGITRDPVVDSGDPVVDSAASRSIELDIVKPDPSIEVGGVDMIPASVLDTYATQMQRMQDFHHSELQELQKQHEQQLQDIRASLNHDKCSAERDSSSERFMGKLREKEEQLQEVMRVNEGLERKVDGTKRELSEMKEVLKEKERSLVVATSAPVPSSPASPTSTEAFISAPAPSAAKAACPPPAQPPRRPRPPRRPAAARPRRPAADR
jgi:hypothetical protein